MTAKKTVKIELSNSRFVRSELRDHASEFVHYARYAGYILEDFNIHLSNAKLFPQKPDIAERNHRLVVETSLHNAKVIFQITQIYPSFKNWTIKCLTPGVELAPAKSKGKATAETAPKTKSGGKKAATAKTKTAKKVAKKKTAKKAAKKKAAPKESAKKKTAKKVAKKAAKKATAKKTKTAKKVAKKKTAKKAAKKKAAPKKTVKKKTAKKAKKKAATKKK